jgi:hypothetical protein
MTARTFRRTLVVAALAAAAGVTASPAVTSGSAGTGTRLADEICYFRDVPGLGFINYCVPRTPVSQGGCAVNVGTCDGGCTVNLGYCAPAGSCLVNAGACGDGSLITADGPRVTAPLLRSVRLGVAGNA